MITPPAVVAAEQQVALVNAVDWPVVRYLAAGKPREGREEIHDREHPRGCGPLLVAELVARELDSFARELVDIPRIVRRVQLPAFEYDIHAPYAWPRSSSVDAGNLMFRAICELSSRSA